MNASYKEVPVGDEGLYTVQRMLNGAQQYLAKVTDPASIGRYSLGTARVTVRILEGRYGAGESLHTWLDWPTDSLPIKRPCSGFPPGQRSPYDHSARA